VKKTTSTKDGARRKRTAGSTPERSHLTVLARPRPKRVLILGVNGFIGNALVDRILRKTDWKVSGLDVSADRIEEHLDSERFRFLEGDISINREWIEYHVKNSDVVLPLVAIATPARYITDPLAVFRLDFLENLRVVEQAARYGTRVVFASTSEVYGMCTDEAFDEDTSPLIYGPISKQRWIYSSSKQLLDRVIWAYGDKEGLPFTLFRPFNWIGPKLDSIETAKEGSSRVLTQFVGNVLRGEPIRLVDGGTQRRCFTDIDDGIDGLMAILENRDGVADGQIFNLGNPANDFSVRELAKLVLSAMKEFPRFRKAAESARIIEVTAGEYYGVGYQDVQARVPKIEKAKRLLGWTPKISMKESLRRTLHYYHEKMESPT
jgi:nucleoside-diphosphate-sugar epimerase